MKCFIGGSLLDDIAVGTANASPSSGADKSDNASMDKIDTMDFPCGRPYF
jgi:hypothetical protein